MRRVLLFLIFLIIAISAGVNGYLHRSLWSRWPWQTNFQLSDVSAVSRDAAGNLYVIDNSKQDIKKMSNTGKLLVDISEQSRNNSHQINDFDGLTTDKQGNIYVLNTVLDSNGLYVKKEEILKYNSDGHLLKVLYTHVPQVPVYRVGYLQDLQVHNSLLSFYVVHPHQIQDYQMNTSGGHLAMIRQIDLPGNQYAALAAGDPTGNVVYSTRTGDVVEVQSDNQRKVLYPSHLATNALVQTGNLSVDPAGYAYFSDIMDGTIYRANLMTSTVKPLLNQQQVTQQGDSIDLTSVQGMISDGYVVAATDSQVFYLFPNGRVGNVLEKGFYSSRDLTISWAYFISLLVGLVSLLLSLRYLYVGVLHRRVPLVLKQVAVFIPLLIISMALLSQVIYAQLTSHWNQDTRNELALLAHDGQTIINGNQLKSLSSAKDYMNPAYASLEQSMNAIYHTGGMDNSGFYNTLYKYQNGSLYVIMDNDNSVPMFLPFDLTNQDRQLIKNGGIATGTFVDAGGNWIYALAPIYDSTGQVVGIYETGKDLNSIYGQKKALLRRVGEWVVGISAVFLLAFVLLTLYLLSSLRKLRNGANAMATGNWGMTVKIKTRDEFSDLGDSFNTMSKRIASYIADVENLNKVYYRFVPQQLLKFLGKRRILDIHLGDQVEQEMSVLVCKVQNFETISAGMTPSQNFAFMNTFLGEIGPVIRTNEGFISNYLGAGMLALFQNNPVQAIHSGVEICRRVQEMSAHAQVPFTVSVSIHRGPLMVGLIGEEERLETGVISETVNLASVVEELSAELSAHLLATPQALGEAGSKRHRHLGNVLLRKLNQSIALFDVYEGDAENIRDLKESTQSLFEESVGMYQNGRFRDAREGFLRVIQQNRYDKAAKLYFYACDRYAHSGPPLDWNGELDVEAWNQNVFTDSWSEVAATE